MTLSQVRMQEVSRYRSQIKSGNLPMRANFYIHNRPEDNSGKISTATAGYRAALRLYQQNLPMKFIRKKMQHIEGEPTENAFPSPSMEQRKQFIELNDNSFDQLGRSTDTLEQYPAAVAQLNIN